MAMTDAKPLFIDTNVLVYANVLTAPLHEPALNAIKNAHEANRPLWISRQVMREFIAARTRPQTFSQPSAMPVVAERIRYFEDHFHIADDTAVVSQQLLELMATHETGGKQVHDANIVATMLSYNIPSLLTHNARDFQRFSDVIKIESVDAN